MQPPWAWRFAPTSLLLLVGSMTSAAAAGTGPAALVADLNPSRGIDGSSHAQGFASFKNDVFFSAESEEEGDELWRTDGTDAKTVRVKDIRPGPLGSHPRHLTTIAGVLYFVADDGSTGPRLWRSDGTSAGTALAPNLVPTGTVSYERLDEVPGILLLVQREGSVVRLWRSNGTVEGTQVLWSATGAGRLDITGPVTALGGALIFAASDQCRTCIPTLWRADTAGSSALFQGWVSGISTLNGKVYFAGQPNPQPGAAPHLGLWRTDGTSAGTAPVKSFGNGSIATSYRLSAWGTDLLFSADDGVSGLTLWRSDGSEAGTVPVIPSGPLSPKQLTVGADAVYFTAGTSGNELWKTDGTAAKTLRVFGTDAAALSSLAALPQKLLFVAAASNGDLLLRAVDGGGQVETLHSFVAKDSTQAPSLTPIGPRAFFSADGGSGSELWVSDGTAAGTSLVHELWPASTPSHPTGMTQTPRGVVFAADDGLHALESGPTDGTALLSNLVAGAPPKNLTSANGWVFFTQRLSNNAVGLWRTDGTAQGTLLLRSDLTDDQQCGGYELPPCAGNLTPVNNTLYFTDWTGQSTREYRLWSSDGSPEGTSLVRGGFAQPLSSLAAGGTSLYFGAAWGQVGTTLSRSDGTGATTQMLKDLVPPYGSAFPEQMTWVNGTLYFLAYGPGSKHPVLWKSNGTELGTGVLFDLAADEQGKVFDSLTRVGSQLFFTANDGVNGWELWRTDGTAGGTRLVRDIAPGLMDAQPSFITEVGETAFFWANDGVHGWELWKSDGTGAGTVLVRDIQPGPTGSVGSPVPLFSLTGNLVLFAASDGGEFGTELWRSDGTSEGTFLVQDIAVGPGSSNPTGFQLAQGKVYFQANDGSTGKELWSLPTSALFAASALQNQNGKPGSTSNPGSGGSSSHGCQTATGAPASAAWLLAIVLGMRRRARRESNPRLSDSKSDALSS